MHFTLFITFLCAALTISAPVDSELLLLKKRAAVDFVDPRIGEGSLLNESGGPGLGEPLNVIISGKSSPEVLTQEGFLNYARAIGLSNECLGQHEGAAEPANLGDGNGFKGEREVLRQHFTIPVLGTCLETLVGGNHLRTYPQNGPNANTGALFLAVSKEENLAEHHDIVPNGYNIGRDELVAAAVGTKKFLSKTYTTTVTDVTGLLQAGVQGVNHGIAIDGIIKLLTVTVSG